MVESEKKTANRGNDNRVLHPSNCCMVDFARENGLVGPLLSSYRVILTHRMIRVGLYNPLLMVTVINRCKTAGDEDRLHIKGSETCIIP